MLGQEEHTPSVNLRDASSALDRIERALGTLAEANTLLRATLQQLPALIQALSALQEALDPAPQRAAASRSRLWEAVVGEEAVEPPATRPAVDPTRPRSDAGKESRYDLWGRAP